MFQFSSAFSCRSRMIGAVREFMIAAAVGVIATACSEPTPLVGPTKPVLGQPKAIVFDSATGALIASARARYAWLGTLHGQAMEEVVTWVKQHPHASKAEKCSMLLKLGVKYDAIARSAGHIDAAPRNDSASVANAARFHPLCAPASSMSLFGRGASLSAASLAGATEEVLFAYMDEMMNNFGNSDGTPILVAYGLNYFIAVAANDPGLTDEEFQALVAYGDFIASSHNTWYSYQQQGDFGAGEIEPVNEMSIFRGFYQDRNTYDWIGMTRWLAGKCNAACRRIGKQDAWGVLSGWIFGGVVVAFEAGIVTSGSQAISEMQ